MYDDKGIIKKQEVITPITNSIIPEDCFQNNRYVINFTSNDMISKF